MSIGNAIVGALRVVLGLDAAGFESGLKKSGKSLDTFGAGFARAGVAVAAAATAMGGALAYSMKGAIDNADKLSKMSQKIGIPVEELSALKHAADLSGVGIDELQKGIGKLSKTMVEAAAKPTSEAAYAFRALGVSVTDSSGKLRTSSSVFESIAEKFSGLKDGAGKTAVAMALFGRAGADLIPLLNSGRDGIREMMDEAAKLGIVIDTKTGKAAEAFNDNLTRLGRAKDGLILKLTAGLLPQLENLTNSLVATAKDTAGVKAVAEGLASTLKVLATAITVVGASFTIAGNNIATVLKALWQAATGDLKAAWETLTGGFSSSASIAMLAGKTLINMWAGAEEGAVKAAEKTKAAEKAQRDFNYATMAGKTAVDGFIDSTNKALAAQQADAAMAGAAIGSKERMRVVLQGMAVAQQNLIKLTPQLMARFTELGNAAEQSAIKLAGVNMTEEMLLPWQKYDEQLTKINFLYAQGAISSETYSEAMRRAAESAGTSWDVAGASIAGSFSDIAKSFGKENSAMAKAAQIFGAIQATISMFTGAAKALELPFPANLAAMATVLAKGASLVASIKGNKVPSMASGGSFRVPGGISMRDNKTIPINLASGERVKVEPNKYGADGSSSEGQRNLSIHVNGETFGRETLRQIATGIEKLVGDGLRVNLVSA